MNFQEHYGVIAAVAKSFEIQNFQTATHLTVIKHDFQNPISSVSNWPIMWKSPGDRATWSAIWNSETLIIHIWATFGLIICDNVEIFWCAFPNWQVTRKWLAIERNRLIFGDSLALVIHVLSSFDLIVFKMCVWGYQLKKFWRLFCSCQPVSMHLYYICLLNIVSYISRIWLILI